MADFDVPALEEYTEPPKLAEGATGHLSSFQAAPEHQEALGFPGELVEGWHDKAIEKFDELLGRSRSLRVYLDACVRCGACTDKCHYFLGTGDPKNMPVARQDLMRKVYRRHFFSSVLAMPPLFRLLSLRHRHRRDLDGGQGDHGPHRQGSEVLQRNHRQGP
jgi:hypothetical protein